MKLDNSISAVITGGASGLGRASAYALASAGVKVAIFDLNEEWGAKVAEDTGGSFHKVNILDEASVEEGFAAARAAQGQERILVHCAQVSKGARTISKDKETGGWKRFSTEDYAFSAQGILIASYRMASLSALGMASLDPLEDGERGCITLTASVAAQDAQIGLAGRGAFVQHGGGPPRRRGRDRRALATRSNPITPGIFPPPPMLAVKDRSPAIWDGLNASVPFPKRLGKPEEFGSLILELNRNTYFNGQNLRLDGAIRMPPR